MRAEHPYPRRKGTGSAESRSIMRQSRWTVAVIVVILFAASSASADDWPQWRGPARTNIAHETGLLKTWPDEGPPLAWKAEGLGTGPMSLSVAGGRIFTQGYRDEREYLHALDAASVRILWSSPIGPGIKSAPGMDWLSQRTPTLDGDRLYAFGVKGALV